MTVSSPELPNRPSTPPPDAWYPEDEIDLRQYVLVLVAWWREIVLIALLTAVAAAAFVLLSRFISSPIYEASATVAIARTQSSVNFDERFQTTMDQGDNTANSRVIDYTARRAALVGLVGSSSIAQAVIDQLTGQLDGEYETLPAYWLGDERVTSELLAQEGSRSASDLIRITVQANSPEKAVAVANAWAENYVAQVNKLYGEVPAELVASVEVELGQAQSSYEQAQSALEEFIASNEIERLNRLIAEKQDIIGSLQQGRQTAITTIVDEELAARRQIISAYINAQASNRLLAFNKEQEAKRGLISALIEADSSSRLQAFQFDQEARQKLFGQYVRTLIDNQLAALQQEQAGRSAQFQAFASADARSKVAVFNEQVEQKLQTLAGYYERKREFERLLSDAQGLWMQVSLGGEASVQSNGLAILLLKAEVYATSAQLPADLQLRLDDLTNVSASAESQAQDVDALIDVLRTRLSELDRLIALQSRLVFNNEGYDLLDAQRPDGDPLFAALQQKYLELFDLGPLAQNAGQVQSSALSQAIQAKYDELFVLGSLGQASTVFSSETPLFASIQSQYPSLFDTGSLSALTEQVTTETTPLALLSEERAKELLQLQGLEDVPGYTATAEPLLQAIDKLEKEIQSLQAQRENQSARRDVLTRQRDLALSTLNTLRNKQAELNLTRTVTNSEVRFASPAVEPLNPVARTGLITTTALAGIVGVMLAVFVVFFANFMGAQPWLARSEVGTA